MIYRLRYCNKDGVEARVEIQKGLATPVYAVEGTDNPFMLFYNNDRGDKSGSVRSSGADVNIYETAEFNIDELKTSSETDISVKYYINDVLQWSGFVIPDFFSKQITGGAGIVSMVASDRLSTLKGVTLSGLSAKISNRALAEMCLANTGLSLQLYTMADFTGDGVNIFNSEVLSQRMIDTKGRSISCYDILSSLLEQTNSLLIQRAGAWHIINKVQLEAGAGSLYSNATTSTAWSENTVNFSDVNVGARRKIIPVASMVGVYHEHGGGRLHPDNYDFSQGLTGWTAINGFNASIDDREILYYSNGNPYYGDATDQNYLVNLNERVSGSLTLDTAPYLQSEAIPVVSTQGDMVEISLDINITAPGGGSNSSFPSFVRYAIIATNGSETYALNRAGTFDVYDATNLDHSQIVFIGSDVFGQITAVSKGQLIKGKLERDLSDYTITVRIYGSGTYQVTTVNFISLQFSNSLEVPKGTMYKREQGANYTKTHDIPTVLWGDYLTNGLNGYFYEYPIDDTSSLYLPDGNLHSTWTAYGDTDQIPLLQHVSRQKARMFSVAHDLLSAEIEVSNFDPLAIFVACEKRYTVVSAQFDFFKSNLSVELEEVAFQNNVIREYIYSYFGDGEDNIKSIGGISAGASGSGSGGGLTPGQLEILSWWKKDPANPNTIFTEMNAYSMGELSAYGLGSGGGGGDYNRLDIWADYDSSKSGWVLSAFLGNDLNTRVTTLEQSAGGGSVTSVGISVPIGLSVANSPITTSGVIAISLQTGYSIPTTAKQNNWDTAFTNNHTHANKTVLDGITSALVANWDTAFTNNHTHSNKTVLDGITSALVANWDTAYNHSQAEHQAIINGTGFVKANGKTLSYDNNSYSLSSHNHSGVYEPVLGNPSANGYLLSSTTAGVRSWVAPYSLPTASASVLGGVKIGANVSIASGVISVHNPVTIGTANGLSLSTQALSLALATTSASGALSATDKTYIDLLKTFFEYDSANNAIKALKSLYSTGEVSAYGIGSGGGGGSYDRLDAWADYDSTKSGWVLSALLGVDLNTRVGNLEGGSALTVNTTGTGNAITSISKAGTVITATKGATFSLDNHLHTGVYEPVFTKNSAFNKNFGTTAGTVAEGNDSRIINGQTAYGWGNHATAGYVPTSRTITAGNGLTGGGALSANQTLTLGTPSNITPTSTNSVTSTSHTHKLSMGSGSGLDADLLDGKQYQNILERRYSGTSSSGTATGWFRIAEFLNTNAFGANCILHINRLYGYASTETYTFSISMGYAGTFNITQLSGAAGSRLITKIRVSYTNSGAAYIDIYINAQTTNNVYYWTTIGNARSFTAWEANPTAASVYEFYTVNGIKSDRGFTGDITGNASSATKLQTARTIWGQSFDGTGNVTGALSGATTIAASISVTAPKVIFNAAGWSMEQVGDELQMKHNNVLKMRFTSTGSIVATSEITAFA